jgi:hypothetical protein
MNLIIHFSPASYVVQHQKYYNITTIHILHTQTQVRTKIFHILLITQTAYL